VAGDDRGLELVRPGSSERGGAGDEPAGSGNGLVVPSGAVLALKLDDLVVVVESGGGPGPVQPDEREQVDAFEVVVSLSLTPLLFLSGAVFPPNGLPGWLGKAVLMNPMTYAIDAIRRVLPGDFFMDGMSQSPRLWGWTPPVWVELGAVASLAFAALAVASYKFLQGAEVVPR
jgi:ABC-2 type transport system permease protein